MTTMTGRAGTTTGSRHASHQTPTGGTAITTNCGAVNAHSTIRLNVSRTRKRQRLHHKLFIINPIIKKRHKNKTTERKKLRKKKEREWKRNFKREGGKREAVRKAKNVKKQK